MQDCPSDSSRNTQAERSIRQLQNGLNVSGQVGASSAWQANRLEPDEIIGPLAPLLRDVEVWRNPKSRTSGYKAAIKEFDGINKHHYWIVATAR